MAEAVSENVYAGTAMLRRGIYYSGANVAHSAESHVGMGLGFAASTGTVGLLAADEVDHPDRAGGDGRRRAVRLPDDAGHRGALGDELPAARSQGPVYGRERHAQPAQHPDAARSPGPRRPHLVALPGAGAGPVRRQGGRRVRLAPLADVGQPASSATFLEIQRDLYAYLHDQTLRMMNQGLVGAEIAELIQLPPALEAAWHTHGYYGSVSHNVKAVYQRYLGWYSGHPSDLWEHPPAETAKRYAICFGGVAEPGRQGPRVRRRRRPALRRAAAQARRLRRPREPGREAARWPTSSNASPSAPRTPPGATAT